MNKIGEGKNPAREPNIRDYHKALEQAAHHFATALHQYSNTSREDRLRLRASMDSQIQLIYSAVSELKRSGISKEAVKLEKAYKAYMADANSQNLAALEHEICTIREFNC